MAGPGSLGRYMAVIAVMAIAMIAAVGLSYYLGMAKGVVAEGYTTGNAPSIVQVESSYASVQAEDAGIAATDGNVSALISQTCLRQSDSASSQVVGLDAQAANATNITHIDVEQVWQLQDRISYVANGQEQASFFCSMMLINEDQAENAFLRAVGNQSGGAYGGLSAAQSAEYSANDSVGTVSLVGYSLNTSEQYAKLAYAQAKLGNSSGDGLSITQMMQLQQQMNLLEMSTNLQSTMMSSLVQQLLLLRGEANDSAALATAGNLSASLAQMRAQADATNQLFVNDSGNYTRSMSASQAEQVQQSLSVFEQYYQSASALLAELNSQIESTAAGVAR